MCGICGFVCLEGAASDGHVLRQMNATLEHRGPDGEGIHEGAGVGLAMRRLSIIDLAGSDQPLYNEDERIALVFNGEIFNFRELRTTLQAAGHQFNTGGDGETIAHLYEDMGDNAPQQLRGQFAFALWDAGRRRLLLARDRMGQKPLYYYHDPVSGLLVFGSEIKALLRHPDIPRVSALDDPATLALYLGYGYVPAPQTAFAGIQMLLPGHILTWQDGRIQTRPYWTAPTPAPEDLNARMEDYLPELREAINEAVRLRLIADVPLGAFLSGGLDSSLIVALMQQMGSGPVRTFSIGFEGDDSFDETSHAETVARYLGTEHTAFHVSPDALELLPRLVWHHDQPFADSSAIPTYLVSELTRQHVTVALTGDGGDELFAGYDRFRAAAIAHSLRRVPRPVWRVAAGVVSQLPQGTGYYDRIKRAGRFFRAAGMPLGRAYFDWVRLFSADAVQALVQQADRAGDHFMSRFPQAETLPGILEANMHSYLPDDLLIKADRCSMAASLEARAPFMDHPLVELAARIPFNLKLRGNVTKAILKESARGLLPDAIIDRPKHGFGVPLGAWLRRDPAPVRDLLLDGRARARGVLNNGAVAALIDEHVSGRADHGQRLWTLLTLEQWYRLFIDMEVAETP